jgi:hypothetical protein
VWPNACYRIHAGIRPAGIDPVPHFNLAPPPSPNVTTEKEKKRKLFCRLAERKEISQDVEMEKKEAKKERRSKEITRQMSIAFTKDKILPNG